MAYEFEDSFADADGTALEDHTPTAIYDDSATAYDPWIVDSSTFKIFSNRAYMDAPGGGTGKCRASVVPSALDVPIVARLRLIALAGNGTLERGLQYNYSTGSGNHYRLTFYSTGSGTDLKLTKNTLGVVATVSNPGFEFGTDIEVEYAPQISGSDLILNFYVRRSNTDYLKSDGTWQSTKIAAISYTDTSPLTLGSFGIYAFDQSSSTSGLQLDRIYAGTPPLVAASSYTLGGATDNVTSPGVASAAYVVECNGTLTATITPSDGGAGGTFTPSTLSFAAEAGPKVFTYTPTAGAVGTTVTISTTNDGGLSNPSSLDIKVLTGRCVLHGNSQFTIGTPPAVAANLQTLLGDSWEVENYATGGVPTPTLTGQAAVVLSRFNAHLSHNCLVMTEIINDLKIGDDADAAYSHLVDYSVQAFAHDFEFYPLTPTSRGDGGTPADYETLRQEVIASMVANAATIATSLVRIDLDPHLGPEGAYSDSTYYQDATHWNDGAGCSLVAQLIYDQLPVSSTPATPTSFSITAIDATGMTVGFTGSANAGSFTDLTYQIERSTNGTDFSLLTYITGTSYKDTTTVNGVEYYYRVYASSAEFGESAVTDADSGVAQGPVFPDDTTPPTLDTAVASTDGTSVVLTFDEDIEDNTAISGLSLTAFSAAIASAELTDTDEITLTLSGALEAWESPALSYFPGNLTDTSDNALEAFSNFPIDNSSNTNDPAPAAPQGLTLATSDGQITVSWLNNPPGDFDHYELEQSTDGENFTLVDDTITDSSFDVTGLDNGTRYYFRIRAVDSASQAGAYSEISSGVAGAHQRHRRPPLIIVYGRHRIRRHR